LEKGARSITGVIRTSAALTVVLLLAPAVAYAQDTPTKQSTGVASTAVKGAAAGTPESTAESAKPVERVKGEAAPLFSNYKGVKIGMSADEVRRLLGNPKEKSKEQDFFTFSEEETAQVFYDGVGKVTAVAVTFYGRTSGAPVPAEVLGKDVEAKGDGSLYHLERYPGAVYWVSYSRTAGDAPLVTLTMRKIP
jgi:hypothetical protein